MVFSVAIKFIGSSFYALAQEVHGFCQKRKIHAWLHGNGEPAVNAASGEEHRIRLFEFFQNRLAPKYKPFPAGALLLHTP